MSRDKQLNVRKFISNADLIDVLIDQIEFLQNANDVLLAQIPTSGPDVGSDGIVAESPDRYCLAIGSRLVYLSPTTKN